MGITGIGGLGKSTLAAKIYDEDSTEFDDKVWADISRIGFTELARRVLLKFGVSPETIEAIPEQSLGDALVNHLRQGRYLLVMDNLETLLQSDGEDNKNTSIRDESYRQFFYGWLECGGKSVVLVTTRERLDLPPIRCQWLSLLGLEPVEGATLLQALGIRGTEEELVEFSQKVEEHPLLLTLVAGFLLEEEEVDPQIRYLQRYGLADISHLLTDDNLKGLHRGTVDIWMRRVLDESFGRISQRMQQLVLGICVYRIPFNSAMALVQIHSLSFERDLEVSQPQNKQERSSLDSSLDSPDSLSPPFEGGLGGSKRDNLDTKSIEKDLRQLVRRSLLQEERDKDGGRWFKFQPLIQEYAKCQAEDLTQAHQRAIDYYRLNLKQPPWKGIEDVTEYLEIFYHWCELKKYIPAFNILHYCHEFLKLRGYNQIQVRLYNRLIWEWNRSKSDWVFGSLLIDLGSAYSHLGEYPKAIDYDKQSLAIFKEIGNRTYVAISRLNLGNAYYFIGDYKKSIEYSQEALIFFKNNSGYIRDKKFLQNAIAVCLNNLGNSYRSLCEYRQSIEYHQKSLALFQENGDKSKSSKPLMNLGSVCLLLADYKQAIEYYKKSLALFQDNSDQGGIASSLDNLGVVYRYLGEYKKAIDYHKQSLVISQEIGNRLAIASSLYNLGAAYFSLGEYQCSIAYHQQALAIEQKIGDRCGMSHTFIGLGNTYSCLGEYQQATEYYQLSIVVCKEIGDCNSLAIAMDNLGVVYHDLGQHKIAIKFSQQSLAIQRQIGDRRGMANSLINLGNAYNCLGQYQDSIEFLMESLTIQQEIGNRSGIADALNNLGNTYSCLGQYQNSIEYYQQALAIQKEVGERCAIARCLNDLGNAYHSLEKYSLAIEYHQKSLVIFEKISHRYGIAVSLHNLGKVYNSLREYQQAIGYYQQALEIQHKIGTHSFMVETFIGLGNAYNRLGEYKQTIENYQQSLMIFKEIGNRHEIARTLQKLAQAYYQCGRVKEGFATAYQATQILQELELPLDAMPYPQWFKSSIKFAQRGKLHLVLCFIAGLIAFPFALLVFTTLILWRIIRVFIKRQPQHP
ncbi:MAG: tetratricopeptide repeat protein [Coleofasciculus sp. A1-SPW-01]